MAKFVTDYTNLSKSRINSITTINLMHVLVLLNIINFYQLKKVRNTVWDRELQVVGLTNA